MRPFLALAKYAATHPVLGAPQPDQGGYFTLGELNIIASWVEDWDHVSVSTPYRTPTWAEMEAVKRVFFRPDEVAYQLHVAEKDHISRHSFCLHMWRPHFVDIPLPPKEFVG